MRGELALGKRAATPASKTRIVSVHVTPTQPQTHLKGAKPAAVVRGRSFHLA